MSSWDPPLDIQAINTTGFLCSLDDQIVKFYTLEYGLLELPISDNGEKLVLGKWYSIFEGDYETHFDFEMTDCKVWANTVGQVFAQVMAIGPNEFALPREIRNKYRMTVWSPFLKFLDDKEDLFNSTFRGGDVGEVVVKFAPSKDHPTNERIFEVVQIVERETPPQNVAYARLPPWTMEFLVTRMEPVHVLHPALPIVNRYGLTVKNDVTVGICIKVDVNNPAYCAAVKGSLEKCGLLFSPKFGLTKWLIREMEVSKHVHKDKHVTGALRSTDEPSFKLGKWYKYQLRDNRHAKSRAQKFRSKTVEDLGPTDTVFYNTTAVQVKEVEPQKHTCLINGNVEMDASFAFNHKMLEDPENQEQPWEIRSQQLSKSAHFVDVDIGRVEIHPNDSQFILQKIEAHRKMLEEKYPNDYTHLKNETLIVRATVKVHDRFMENSEDYPNHGIFIVRKITSIFYLNRGKMIYDSEKEKETPNLHFEKLTL
ncbi:hypothetical protein L5515_018711 [Caenorhabditis briggsae]|uniref:Uncharacterized protein n=1 Tax=Caenorhabditis briggsae TaxID=6238 RepID=A0AAE9FMT4_CAEBR|nr:hypothetical protein L5515_018711 [Caenorhabditis briggsae]